MKDFFKTLHASKSEQKTIKMTQGSSCTKVEMSLMMSVCYLPRVQHANQLCTSKLEIPMNQKLDLLLKILLDTFDLLCGNVGMSTQNRSVEHRSRHQRMKTRQSI